MTLPITRRAFTTGLAGLAATPLLPPLTVSAAAPPQLVLSLPMQEALALWLSYRDEYLLYGVEPLSTLDAVGCQRFLDEPWPGQRAMAIARLAKYTERLLCPVDWYRSSDDAEALCWVMDQFYSPARLPFSNWAREEFAEWNEYTYHTVYMAFSLNGRDVPDRMLDRSRSWRMFMAEPPAKLLSIEDVA